MEEDMGFNLICCKNRFPGSPVSLWMRTGSCLGEYQSLIYVLFKRGLDVKWFHSSISNYLCIDLYLLNNSLQRTLYGSVSTVDHVD